MTSLSILQTLGGPPLEHQAHSCPTIYKNTSLVCIQYERNEPSLKTLSSREPGGELNTRIVHFKMAHIGLLAILTLVPSVVAGVSSFVPGRGCGTSKEISRVKQVLEGDDLAQMERTLVEVKKIHETFCWVNTMLVAIITSELLKTSFTFCQFCYDLFQLFKNK